jgi:hypothetical protein
VSWTTGTTPTQGLGMAWAVTFSHLKQRADHYCTLALEDRDAETWTSSKLGQNLAARKATLPRTPTFSPSRVQSPSLTTCNVRY